MSTLRPDVVLELPGGRRIVLRPDMDSLEAIETRCKAGISVLFERLQERDVRFSDLAAVVHLGARSAASKASEEVSYKEAFDLAQAHTIKVAMTVLEFLAGAFGPPPEQKAGAPPSPPPAS